MPPPSREARQFPCPGMPLVDETSANASRAAVQIFVAAPHREIRSPLVQTQQHISRRVRQIKSHDASLARPAFVIAAMSNA